MENVAVNSLFDNLDSAENDPRRIKTEQIEQSKMLYATVVRAYNRICEQLKVKKEVNCAELLEYVERLAALLRSNQHMLMGLAQAPLPYVEKIAEPVRYRDVVTHGINTTIYALLIANSLGFAADKFNYLGMASLLHNIGRLDFDGKTDSVSSNIVSDLRVSAESSNEYLSLIKLEGLHRQSLESIIHIIQSRESVLNQTSLHNTLQQYAMVVHICSVFVRLTHDRDSDRILAPAEAMKTMRSEMRDFFHPDVIKLFFNKLSIYPIGTFVKLSSQEIAKIVDINENFLMRPSVLVVLGSDKEEKFPHQRVDLRQNPNIYIKKAIVDDVLTERFIDCY